MVHNLQSVPPLPQAVEAAQSQELGVWKVAIAKALRGVSLALLLTADRV
jgi:hypothetical protein